jgi:hypothetical protein
MLIPEDAAGWSRSTNMAHDPLEENDTATHLATQGDVEPQGSVAWTATING